MVAATSSKITVERIRHLFDYDSETGAFSHRIGNRVTPIGFVITGLGMYVDGEHHKTSRFIWLHYYGEWPPQDQWVDHKDGIKSNNRIDNLRLATPTQNQQNKAGYGSYAKGVTWRNRKEKPFQAKIRVNGDRIHLGSFATEEEAAEAYRQAAKEHHGEFACVE